jgi:hypothetical protein
VRHGPGLAAFGPQVRLSPAVEHGPNSGIDMTRNEFSVQGEQWVNWFSQPGGLPQSSPPVYSQLKYDRVVLSLITTPLASISGWA